MSYGEKPFEAFRVGDATTFSKTIGEADILLFAAVSGDNYPLHVDAEYAKTTRFGAARGARHADREPALDGRRYAAAEARRDLRRADAPLPRPVFIGDTLTATAEVTELIPERRRMRIAREVVNQRGETVLEGEGLIQKDAR